METDYSVHYKEMNPNSDYERVYPGVKVYYDAEFQQILPFINKNLPAVDIGSGYGYMARYLRDNGFNNITCVDTSSGLLEIVNEWVGAEIKTCKMDGLDFLDSLNAPTPIYNKLGLITMIDLFEHFEISRAVSLTNAAFNALSDEGYLIIRTPNMANILGIYSKYIDITHYQCYTEFSLKQVLIEGGFNKDNIKFWGPVWPKKSKFAKYQKINNWIHKKLFQIHDRSTPLFFDKNLLVTAKK